MVDYFFIDLRLGVFSQLMQLVIGVIGGANAMAGLFGTSPGGPFDSARASVVHGFAGLIAGAILHRFIRPQPDLGEQGFPD